MPLEILNRASHFFAGAFVLTCRDFFRLSVFALLLREYSRYLADSSLVIMAFKAQLKAGSEVIPSVSADDRRIARHQNYQFPSGIQPLWAV